MVMRTPVALPPSLSSAMRRGFKHILPLPDHLTQEARHLREEAEQMPHGVGSKCSCGRRVRQRPAHTWASGFRRRDYNHLPKMGSYHEQPALPRVCPGAVYLPHRNRYHCAVQVGRLGGLPCDAHHTQYRTYASILQSYWAVLAGKGTHGTHA